MKKILCLVAVVLMIASFSVSAEMLSDKTATRIDKSEVSRMWSQVGEIRHEAVMPHSRRTSYLAVFPEFTQANATVDVTVSGQNVRVSFTTLESVTKESLILFRLTLPNGTAVPLEGFQVSSEGTWGSELWNGPFPNVWPAGWTRFEVIVIPSDGQLTYVSALVPVHVGGLLSGPLTGADVAQDGTGINVTGYFQGLTTVSISGRPVPMVSMGFSPTTGEAINHIDITSTGIVQGTLAVCSGGECSSREVYVRGPNFPIPVPRG